MLNFFPPQILIYIVIYIYLRHIMIPEIPDDPTELDSIFKQMKQNVHLNIAKDLKWRKQALQALINGYESMKEQISAAIKQDLGQNQFMAEFGAHSLTMSETKHLLSGLDDWVKPKSISTPIGLGMASCSLQAQPLGLVLVVSAWNYPIYTAIPQVAAAISAGNCVILKPSECAPYTSNALKKLFDTHMDKRFYRVIEGKVQIAKAIVKLPFDLICFTGSTITGRLVGIEAAKNLTPCILELGGKCPTIIDETAKLQSAAMRVLFGKFFNCGQTCIGVDHLYVHESIKDKFKSILLSTAEQFYGNGQNIEDDGNYGKIINSLHVNRLERYLNDKHGGKIIYGGVIKKQKRFISPTIIESPNKDCELMKDQIFGPILPIHYYTDIKQVVKQIVSRPKPLVVYLFSESSKNISYVRQNTYSGAFTHNDTIVQMLNSNLPFGGVGGSGYGRYHGQSGFLAFSNQKSLTTTMARNSFPLNQRFPPYTDSKKSMMVKLLKFGGITYSQIGKFFAIVLFVVGLVTIGATLGPKLTASTS